MVNPEYLIRLSWLVPLFPLAGFLVNSLGHKRIPGTRGGYLASLSVGMSFLFTLLLFIGIRQAGNTTHLLHLTDWIVVRQFKVPLDFLIDPLSVTMMLIVTGVGLLIHVFSIGYMKGDERLNAFFSQMNLFTFFMLLLVMGANYLILFIGWEGVGLCSYLLIGFWYKTPEYNLAARKAFIMNRIGDLGFLLGIFLFFYTFQTVSFQEAAAALSRQQPGNLNITIMTLLLLVGALGKSAQIPLYTWLPDAMAGPTPVSALIHAATMVTAGIYMIARSSPLFVLAPFTMEVIAVIGIATALFAASIGLFQNDIKKVLAYSTVSQLGYMFLALGVGAFSSAVFHLTTHAFFKALLFLAAGSVIHALHGEQDIRKMGGLKKWIPYTFATFLIGTLAISGIPPFAGFFSKDEILVRSYEANPLLYWLGLLGALLTCLYMFRLLYLVFYGSFRGKKADSPVTPHESPKVMIIPLLILAILSVSGGFLNIPALFHGRETFSAFLSPSLAATAGNHSTMSHALEWMLLLSSFLLLLAVTGLAWWWFVKRSRVPGPDGQLMPWPQKILVKKYFVDEWYHWMFVRPYESLSSIFAEKVEKGVIDRLVNLAGDLVFEAGRQVRRLQNGNISFYAFVMLAGILLFFMLSLMIR